MGQRTRELNAGLAAEEQAMREFALQRVGRAADLDGVDFIDRDGNTVSVKADTRMAETGNLFFEIEKRTDGQWNGYDGTGEWYKSKSIQCAIQIFVCDEFMLRVPTERLIAIIRHHSIATINTGTSRGFVVPIKLLRALHEVDGLILRTNRARIRCIDCAHVNTDPGDEWQRRMFAHGFTSCVVLPLPVGTVRSAFYVHECERFTPNDGHVRHHGEHNPQRDSKPMEPAAPGSAESAHLRSILSS